ncbi:MAG: chemotaxis protein CheB [Planctomycetaceae bacterium]
MNEGKKAAPDEDGFPIVGIGASAGGLEALSQFFDAMPPNRKIAFVVVTHQHAGHISLLPELLSKHSEMEVCEARDGSQIKPNRVYIAPPLGQLHLLDGKLVLIPAEPGLHLHIDTFFRSLAIDQKHRAIAIVLSGAGSDGTLGVKAIKSEGGMVMAQDRETAKHSSMPRSAVATGVVDFVLPVNSMPKKLLEYATAPVVAPASKTLLPARPALDDVVPQIFLLLRNRTRHDFSHYKSNTVSRRIERRMWVHQLISPQDYLRFLQGHPHELDVLFRELLIGVTSFFRDPEAFVSLADNLLPRLIESKTEGYMIRMWSAGCSTGEEAYSLAITAREVIERVNPGLQLQVFATDLDDRAIDTARRGVYPAGIAADMSEERLQRFFIREEDCYRVRKVLREHVIFAPQNIISDPPFTKLDVLCCRNVLIYMDAVLQTRLLPVFHYSLRPDGLLFLGSSESINEQKDLFLSRDKKWRLFERKGATRSMGPLAMRGDFNANPSHENNEPVNVESSDDPARYPAEVDLLHLLERRLLRCYAPPTVIASDLGEIVYIHGRTGDFLELAPGQPTNNILTMARPGLQPTLSILMKKVVAEGGESSRQGVPIENNGKSVVVNIIVRLITEPEMIRGLLMITFEEVRIVSPKNVTSAAATASKTAVHGRAAELEQELQYTKENLQITIEGQATTNEELKSSNEELQSTNEELQSTNEELETSKEELQSLNEELETVNAELQTKMGDLSLANDDMTNLLNSTSSATIFLDDELNINRYTRPVTDVIKIIPTDVGRPIGDLVSNLKYDLVPDAQEVLTTLVTKETEVPLR